jgi:hypothetical protein
MSVPYTKTATSLSVVIDFLPTTIPSSHVNFDKIVKLVQNPKTTDKEVKALLDIPAAISTFTGGNVTVINGRLFYKGFEVKSALATLILNLIKSGDNDAAKPFERFLERAYSNPDPRAATDLYEWVAASKLPITEDGCILAWKAVGVDYMSIHSGPRGKLRHQVGDIVSEPRNECDANPNQTCSRGIHFCSVDYLKHYIGGGSRIMAVKIGPEDVVAFPKDYGNSKGRCWKLEVVGEVPQDRVKDFYPTAAVYRGWEAPKPQPVKEADFAVGQKWRTREGKTVKIQNRTGRTDYPIRGNNNALYTMKGRYYSDSQTHKLDLVKRVS